MISQCRSISYTKLKTQEIMGIILVEGGGVGVGVGRGEGTRREALLGGDEIEK